MKPRILRICLVFLLVFGFSLSESDVRRVKAISDEQTTIIETQIELYFDLMYSAYVNLETVDLSSVISQSSAQMQLKVKALELLSKRRLVIQNRNYAYVETNRFQTSFDYTSFHIIDDDTVVVSFILYGDQSKSYPPFISLGLNTITINYQSSGWLITDHEYEYRDIFENPNIDYDINYEDLVGQIIDEFTSLTTTFNYSLRSQRYVIPPYTDYAYSALRAVPYANKFYKNYNTLFYTANTSGGDCTNFISQTVWYGFGGVNNSSVISSKFLMDPSNDYSIGWYAGSGGGSAAWEQVDVFWSYMTSYKLATDVGPRVAIISTVQNLPLGGVMQIDFESDNDFDHTVILVDKTKLLFAQHTNDALHYYSDYIGTKRFMMPQYFRVFE